MTKNPFKAFKASRRETSTEMSTPRYYIFMTLYVYATYPIFSSFNRQVQENWYKVLCEHQICVIRIKLGISANEMHNKDI